MNLLEDLKSMLDDSGIFTGYAHSYFGINDDNTTFKEADNWTAFKVEGGGSIDPIYGEPNIRLWIGGTRSGQKDRYDNANSIIDYMNANPKSGAIIHILVQSDIRGAFSLEGDRSYFQIDLRLTQSRG